MIAIEGPHIQARRQVGTPLVLWAIASGDGVQANARPTWTKDGQPVREAAVSDVSTRENGDVKLTLTVAAAEAVDAGTYQVELSDGDATLAVGTALAVELEPSPETRDGSETSAGGAEGEAEVSPQPDEVPLIWDGEFARNTGVALAVVFAVALVPLWWAMKRLIDNAQPAIAQFVSFGLVIAAFISLGAAVFVALLEVRGRARTAEELSGRSTVGTRGMPSPEQVNELIKTFGSLKVPAALMVLSATFFLGAFGLAWKTTPPSGPQPEVTTTITSDG